jgi:hypothetical protein
MVQRLEGSGFCVQGSPVQRFSVQGFKGFGFKLSDFKVAVKSTGFSFTPALSLKVEGVFGWAKDSP